MRSTKGNTSGEFIYIIEVNMCLWVAKWLQEMRCQQVILIVPMMNYVMKHIHSNTMSSKEMSFWLIKNK